MAAAMPNKTRSSHFHYIKVDGFQIAHLSGVAHNFPEPGSWLNEE